jgi:hypothetical protein
MHGNHQVADSIRGFPPNGSYSNNRLQNVNPGNPGNPVAANPMVRSPFQLPTLQRQLQVLAQQHYLQQGINFPVHTTVNTRNIHTTAILPRPMQLNTVQSITAVKILSYQLQEIVKQPPREYAFAFLRLHPVYKYILTRTMAFKFEDRLKLVTETDDRTPKASFFLDKLNKISPNLLREKHSLVGLKCSCCNHSKEHIAGCTSFIDIHHAQAFGLFQRALQSRIIHMTKCPFVNQNEQQKFLPFTPNSQNEGDLNVFIEKWLLVTKGTYFKALPLTSRRSQEALKSRRNETLRILEEIQVTEDTIYDDMVSSIHVGAQKGRAVFENLSESMDEITTPQMEVFLQSYRIHVDGNAKIELQCRRCRSQERTGTMCITVILQSTAADDDGICKCIWDFFTTHCFECSHTPMSIKQLFRERSEPPMENLKSFLSTWKTRFERKLRWTKKAVSPKPDYDIYLPVSIETMKQCGPRPSDFTAVPTSGTTALQCNVDNNDVIMSEPYRDFEGNRRFRQVISEYRGLYLSLPSNQQEVVAENIARLIIKQGGSFYSSEKVGIVKAAFKECLSYTSYALQHGFPDMLRPVTEKNPSSKVYDLEYAPKIGILNGFVQWKNISSSNPEVLIIDPSTRQTNHEFQLPNPKEVEQQVAVAVSNSVHSIPAAGKKALGVVLKENEAEKPAQEIASSNVSAEAGQDSKHAIDLCEYSTVSESSLTTQEEGQGNYTISTIAEKQLASTVAAAVTKNGSKGDMKEKGAMSSANSSTPMAFGGFSGLNHDDNDEQLKRKIGLNSGEVRKRCRLAGADDYEKNTNVIIDKKR